MEPFIYGTGSLVPSLSSLNLCQPPKINIYKVGMNTGLSKHVINFYQLFSVLFIADRLLQILPKLILPRICGQPIDPHVVFRVFHS